MRNKVSNGCRQNDEADKHNTFLTKPGDAFTQPINISRVAETNSVADAGQCNVTSTATGATPVCNNRYSNINNPVTTSTSTHNNNKNEVHFGVIKSVLLAIYDVE